MEDHNVLFFSSLESESFLSLLPIVLAVHETNQNPRLLPNITLGYEVYNNYFSAGQTYAAMIDLLSTGQQNIPNYHCGGWNNLVAAVEGAESGLSIYISTMLYIYKIPQVRFLGHGKGSPDSHYCEVEGRNVALSLKNGAENSLSKV